MPESDPLLLAPAVLARLLRRGQVTEAEHAALLDAVAGARQLRERVETVTDLRVRVTALEAENARLCADREDRDQFEAEVARLLAERVHYEEIQHAQEGLIEELRGEVARLRAAIDTLPLSSRDEVVEVLAKLKETTP